MRAVVGQILSTDALELGLNGFVAWQGNAPPSEDSHDRQRVREGGVGFTALASMSRNQAAASIELPVGSHATMKELAVTMSEQHDTGSI